MPKKLDINYSVKHYSFYKKITMNTNSIDDNIMKKK